MSDSVVREINLPAEAADVWAAIADPARLSEWFGAAGDLPMRDGARGEFEFPDGTVRAVVVEHVDEGRSVAFRWLPFERGPDGTTLRRESTRVEITLEPSDDGTLVRVVEDVVFAAALAPVSVNMPTVRRGRPLAMASA